MTQSVVRTLLAVFVLAERGSDDPVVLSQRDVRELQFAEAAIATGWRMYAQPSFTPTDSVSPAAAAPNSPGWKAGKGADILPAASGGSRADGQP